MSRKKCMLAIAIALASAAAAHADGLDKAVEEVRSFIANSKSAPDARRAYFQSLADDEVPSIEVVRDYVIPKRLDQISKKAIGGAEFRPEWITDLAGQPYYNEILPHFFGGQTGSSMIWTVRLVGIAMRQIEHCDSFAKKIQKAQQEFLILLETNPIDRFGVREFPLTAKAQVDSTQRSAEAACLGIRPVMAHMNSHTKTEKGNF